MEERFFLHRVGIKGCHVAPRDTHCSIFIKPYLTNTSSSGTNKAAMSASDAANRTIRLWYCQFGRRGQFIQYVCRSCHEFNHTPAGSWLEGLTPPPDSSYDLANSLA